MRADIGFVLLVLGDVNAAPPWGKSRGADVELVIGVLVHGRAGGWVAEGAALLGEVGFCCQISVVLRVDEFVGTGEVEAIGCTVLLIGDVCAESVVADFNPVSVRCQG